MDELIRRKLMLLQMITRAYENELGGDINDLLTPESSEMLSELFLARLDRSDKAKRASLAAMFFDTVAELEAEVGANHGV
ncbi:hypothetical protein [Paenibacillus sp. FSL R5-0519]|uniref:hypothetical protein n=1 Tax=Paenibacillus sp. FSL R5-0519 TaxID=2921648 RepID=UPI0030DD58B0